MPHSHAPGTDPCFTLDEASVWGRPGVATSVTSDLPDSSRAMLGSHLIADSLWNASLTGAPALIKAAGLKGAYRSRVFHPIASRTYRLSCARRNPRASRPLMNFLERFAGVPASRTTRPYSHLLGGRESVSEYEGTKNQDYALPYVLVAGYPRSGTTTLQNLARNTYPSHFIESKILGRHSLWSAAKHEIQVAEDLAHLGTEEAVIFVAMRNFRDAAASLLVARGDNPTDLHWEAQRWRQWLALLGSPNIFPVAFEDVSRKSPYELSMQLAQLSQLKIEHRLRTTDSHSQLYELARERDIPDHRKSNLPNAERRSLLSEARAYVDQSIEPRLLGELDDIYSKFVSNIASPQRVG